MGNSCNPYFIELGQKIGGDLIKEYTYKLGLNKQEIIGYSCNNLANNIDFNSKVIGDVANVSIGEKGIRLSPLMVANLMATIGDDGRFLTPKLVNSITNELGKEVKYFKNNSERQAVKISSAKALQYILAEAVLSGTGSPAANNTIAIGGKSGTTQNAGVWFAGFAPVENPKYAMAIYLDNGNSGGKDGGVIMKNIMKKISIIEGI